MSNLLNIVQGWYNYIHATPDVRRLMEKRLAVCNKCEHRKETPAAIQKTSQLLLNQSVVNYCGKCHCPLGPKTAAQNESCPLNYWKPEPKNYY